MLNVGGMLQSFYDAPDGFSEEISELSVILGIEYWYNEVFTLRGGFSMKIKSKETGSFSHLVQVSNTMFLDSIFHT